MRKQLHTWMFVPRGMTINVCLTRVTGSITSRNVAQTLEYTKTRLKHRIFLDHLKNKSCFGLKIICLQCISFDQVCLQATLQPYSHCKSFTCYFEKLPNIFIHVCYYINTTLLKSVAA